MSDDNTDQADKRIEDPNDPRPYFHLDPPDDMLLDGPIIRRTPKGVENDRRFPA